MDQKTKWSSSKNGPKKQQKVAAKKIRQKEVTGGIGPKQTTKSSSRKNRAEKKQQQVAAGEIGPKNKQLGYNFSIKYKVSLCE